MTVQCVNCGRPSDGEKCTACGALLPLGETDDYFSILGIPRKASLDSAELKRVFYRRSKELHPDRSPGAPPAVRLVAFQRSTFLNDAYNALKDPVRRSAYLVRLEGGKDPSAGSDHISSQFFDLVFEVNSAAAALKASGGVDARARASAETIAARVAEGHNRAGAALGEAEAAYDGTAPEGEARSKALETLSERLSDLVYLGKLERTLREALEGVLVA